MTIRFDTLSNGFRVVTEHMPGIESASLGVWITAGGRHERLEQNGIAHFLEHMAFKGTKRRTTLQIAEEIEDVGGYLNAYTGREVTAYYARVLREDVALAVDVISDILMNPVFDPDEIEVERGVILQEIGQALDTPDDVIFDWLQEAAYPEQAIGRPILGPAERVQGFARGDLAGFVDEHYGPDRMILAAAGAVDHDEIMRLAEKAFGGLNRPSSSVIQPAGFVGGERRELKHLEQVHFTLALEGPGYLDDTIYTAQVYANALGGGMSSRLFQEAREKRGLCYTIFSQAGAWSDTGLITIYAGTSAGEIAGLAELTIDELRRAATDMTVAEVDRARAQLRAGMLMGMESASSRAERLARQVAIWNRVVPVEETLARLDSVTTEDVRGLGTRIATNPRAALALYGPAETAPTLSALTDRLAA
ncbi:pitrilysin family protein [Maritimibacter sp. UBA3975]|uniref:M16 family metallopeptidase n=1 Tax=Maritimibacter sp. UBA3975 TaxID=1946833 RepID=UPI0025C564CC|nr:pitrilysin family protein [Maritimibacter sp. UBA3975]|tara:strand:- start:8715 stop:9977 length:1263 start_codon:yes stop_codon:yes gene_type:complete